MFQRTVWSKGNCAPKGWPLGICCDPRAPTPTRLNGLHISHVNMYLFYLPLSSYYYYFDVSCKRQASAETCCLNKSKNK